MEKSIKYQLILSLVLATFFGCKKEEKPVDPQPDPPVVINTTISGNTWTEVLPEFTANERIMGMTVVDDKMLLSFLTSNYSVSGLYDGSTLTESTQSLGTGIGFEKLKTINNVIYGIGQMGDNLYGAYSYDAVNNYWNTSARTNTTTYSMEEYNGVGIVGCAFDPYIRYRSLSSSSSTVGTGLNGDVYSLINFNGKLIAGGSFTFSGSTSVNNVAQWDGTEWLPLGDGLNMAVNDLIVFNDQLIAVGRFTFSGSTPCRYAAIWDGTNWTPLGGGLVGGGQGAMVAQMYYNQLFIGGDFDSANGVNSPNIIKWNGTNWEALAGGASLPVGEICVFKNKLYIANQTTTDQVNFLLRLD